MKKGNSKHDDSWLYVDCGTLYSSPFSARCLLYKVPALDCALLLLQRMAPVKRGTVGAVASVDCLGGQIHTLPPVVEGTVIKSLSTAPASALMQKRRQLVYANNEVGVFSVNFERDALPLANAFGVLPSEKNSSLLSCGDYSISGRAKIHTLAGGLPAADVAHPCWRVSVYLREGHSQNVLNNIELHALGLDDQDFVFCDLEKILTPK